MSNLLAPVYYTEADLAGEGFARLGSNVRIASTCTIVGAGNISIGDNVRIDGYCTLAVVHGKLTIGSHVHIGGYCALLAAEGIEMADFSGLAWGVQIHTRSDDYSGRYMTNPTVPAQYTNAKKGPVRLGRHVIVGAGAVLLPGVALAEGVAVGAQSLVTKSLPEWGIYNGVPARRIAQRSRDLLALEKAYLDALRTAPQERPGPGTDTHSPP
jgi:acetyltransferase-like isoleucine patch superfamily enzyme